MRSTGPPGLTDLSCKSFTFTLETDGLICGADRFKVKEVTKSGA